MFMRVFAVGCLMLVAVSARADQAQWLTQAQAEAAQDALWGHTPLRMFCEPCGDTHWRPLVVQSIEVQPVGEGGYHEVVVNGESIDLAYTYFPWQGAYRNLAMHLEIPVEQVSETLDPWLPGALPDFSGMVYAGALEDGREFIVTLEKVDGDLRGMILLTNENEWLNIEGECADDGQFTAAAYIEEDASYPLEGSIAAEAVAIRGHWESGAGETLAFEARRVAVTVSHATEVAVGPLRATVNMHHPWFRSAQHVSNFEEAANEAVIALLQGHIRSFVSDFPRGFEWLDEDAVPFSQNNLLWESGGCDITAITGSLLSLAFEYYYYTGGAHGMSHRIALTLVADEDGARPLELAELFRPESDFWSVITSHCLADLKEQGASWVEMGTVTDIGEIEHATWTLSRGGLSFYFDPYEMGPYAEGSFQSWVPFDALSDVLKPGMPGVLFDGE